MAPPPVTVEPSHNNNNNNNNETINNRNNSHYQQPAQPSAATSVKKKRPPWKKMSISSDSLLCVLIVLSGTCIAFFVDGFISAVAMFISYWQEDSIASRFALDWISSSMLGGCYLLSPLVNFISSKVGFQKTAIFGSYLAGLSILASAFMTEFWGLFLTLGVVTTFSFALQFITSIICISMNFEEKRPLAMGIVTCGTGLGVTVYSVLTPILNDLYSWQEALIFLACINLQAVCMSALMQSRQVVAEPEMAKSNFFSQLDIASFNTTKQPNTTLAAIAKSTFSLRPDFGDDDFLQQPQQQQMTESKIDLQVATMGDLVRLQENTQNMDINQMIGALGSIIYINKVEEYVPNVTTRSFMDESAPSIFRNVLYLLTLAGSLFYALGMQTPNTYLMPKMMQQGYTDMDVGNVFVVYGMFNSVCRIFVGIVAASKHCNVLYFIGAATTLISVMAFVVPFMYHKVHFYVYALLFASGQATATVLFPLVVAKVVPVKDLTDALSKQLAVMGIGFLLGMPVSGFLYTKTDSFFFVYSYSSGIMMLGAICFMLASLRSYRDSAQKRITNLLKVQVAQISSE